jgi:molybdopterin-guanine dinucleotide biosynthesis adapter protein
LDDQRFPELHPPVVAFVGYSGSGKTTLLVSVVRALKARGVRLAVVKHSGHYDIDENATGSDTRRLWSAGADLVVLMTPDRLALWRRTESEPALSDVLARVVMGLPPDPRAPVGSDGDAVVDLILLEGYKRSSVPKIEVIRAACHPQPIAGLRRRLACVTDVPTLALGCPTFGFDEIAAIVDLLWAQTSRGGTT